MTETVKDAMQWQYSQLSERNSIYSYDIILSKIHKWQDSFEVLKQILTFLTALVWTKCKLQNILIPCMKRKCRDDFLTES